MTIEIHDAQLEARLQHQMDAMGAAYAGEALLRLLDTQEVQDRWLQENLGAINTKIRRGVEQLDRGEGISDEELPAFLTKLKSRPE